MKKTLIYLITWCSIAGLSPGCKTETTNPAIKFEGTWTATYTMQSGSFTDDYKLYSWTAKLVINADGTAHATHGTGNPIINNDSVEEDFSWARIDDHTMYLRSKNWSVTNNTMNYEIREYSSNYIKMDGFDDNLQFWTLIIKK
ncbi:hypothetical protein [Mucilaginibacter aquariorum]|uniref:Lipocalin-like domain-containing protein n=1 Tax=Mucilaginibacter aquariorum TaxID=2967225 RepID=A0ABT1SWU7_9SPHI|nr:hypothetical protein [Mucilaginibacter aquariorum]MCQ6956727.1 hypothetical protein [Mucilaginibacter aquariorum]